MFPVPCPRSPVPVPLFLVSDSRVTDSQFPINICPFNIYLAEFIICRQITFISLYHNLSYMMMKYAKPKIVKIRNSEKGARNCFLKGGGGGGGRVERRCLVNFQCRGVLLVWMIVGQGPIALAVGTGRGVFGHFSPIYLFSFLSPSLWETARYRLKYCLKGPLNPKQPTNQFS